MEHVDTIVIGAGQAGLAMSHHLGVLGREHVILERSRVAERWRSQRWDSLMFQFPSWSIELPGRSHSGAHPDGFTHKDEVVRFIEDYGVSINAPIRCGVNVSALRIGSSSNDDYEIDTDRGRISARHVVIATGPYQRPRRPPAHRRLPPGILQIDAGDYRNPRSLPDGAALVVGSGASGCQIADELLESGRNVYLSIGRHRRVPRRYRGRDAFWWRRELGELDQSVDNTPPAARVSAPLVTGALGGYNVDLRRFAAGGGILLGHLLDVVDGTLNFARDVEQSLRAGDRAFAEFVAAVDAWIDKSGMDAQLPAADVRPADVRQVDSVDRLDVAAAGIATVIWATGYELDFGWVDLPVFDAGGVPVQYRGATAAPGVYFLGLKWMHKLKSSFLCSVGEDAGHIAARIAAEHLQGAARRPLR